MQKILATREDLQAEAVTFMHGLRPRIDSATLVTLSGELGAGKTTFTQAVAATLGITDSVTSPTFVLEKIYTIPDFLNDSSEVPNPISTSSESQFKRLIHIDAYRLDGGVQLAPLGFDELMHAPENLILLEWPEKVIDALPVPTVHITLETTPNNGRTISYD
jgi:tRNA threonylcarbamoyladenosine biosynthesis protein TsaE